MSSLKKENENEKGQPHTMLTYFKSKSRTMLMTVATP